MNTSANTYLSEKTLSIFNEYKSSFKSNRAQNEYYYIINSFCKYCEKDYLDAGLNDFQEYFKSLDTAASMGNTTYKTIRSKHAALYSFSAYIVLYTETYDIPNFQNYMLRIPKPVVSISISARDIPTLEQLDRIYEAAKTDKQMYCIVALINKCALTADQICSLKLANFVIDAENNCGIIFPYQYSSDRKIKLPDDISDIINDYVNFDRANSKSDYLFLNQKNLPLTTRVLQNRMKHLISKAAGDEAWSFTMQDLRNMSVVLMLQNGVGEAEVASYIGIKCKWMQRYQKAVSEFNNAPSDYINLTIHSLARN